MRPHYRTYALWITLVAVGVIGGTLAQATFGRSTEHPLFLAADSRCPVGESARGYQRAKNIVCYNGQGTPIDAASFRPLEANFAIDAKYVYFQGSPVPGADPKTFHVADDQTIMAGGNVYALDEERVFSACSDCNAPYGIVWELERADPTTFQVLSREYGTPGYAKDAAQVWFFGAAIEGADASTFGLLPAGGSHDATDAENVFVRGYKQDRI